MLAAPLPNTVNIRKAVTRSARYEGSLGAKQIPQFAELLDPASPAIAVVVEFGENDDGQQFAAVQMQGKVVLECQRCLQPVVCELSGNSHLGIVPGDEQAKQLSAGLEPLIAVDEVDLWKLAEEELALALPVVAYHPDGECEPPKSDRQVRSEDQELGLSGEVSENPFSVLSSLLNNDDTKEK
ncbi:YceD family protein [Congregibacter sp.]|uniref:YceD family protein n=1 Tax=Congregibacter sp. TaxID=2744308 RepID=UPI00385EBF46